MVQQASKSIARAGLEPFKVNYSTGQGAGATLSLSNVMEDASPIWDAVGIINVLPRRSLLLLAIIETLGSSAVQLIPTRDLLS